MTLHHDVRFTPKRTLRCAALADRCGARSGHRRLRTARFNSIDFDVERLYDRRPFDDFILDKPLKLRRRGIQIWNKPGFNQHFLIIRRCERIMVRKCNLLDYCGRCPRRGKQADALLRGHARESLDCSG
jgi:hypothetical protein